MADSDQVAKGIVVGCGFIVFIAFFCVCVLALVGYVVRETQDPGDAIRYNAYSQRLDREIEEKQK